MGLYIRGSHLEQPLNNFVSRKSSPAALLKLNLLTKLNKWGASWVLTSEDLRNYKFQCSPRMILAGKMEVLPVAKWDLCIFVLTINNYVSRCVFFIGSDNKNPGLPQCSWNGILGNRFKFEDILPNPSAFLLHTTAPTQVMIRGVLTRILSSQNSNSTSLPGGCAERVLLRRSFFRGSVGNALQIRSVGRPGTSVLRPPGVSVADTVRIIVYPTVSWE